MHSSFLLLDGGARLPFCGLCSFCFFGLVYLWPLDALYAWILEDCELLSVICFICFFVDSYTCMSSMALCSVKSGLCKSFSLSLSLFIPRTTLSLIRDSSRSAYSQFSDRVRSCVTYCSMVSPSCCEHVLNRYRS